MSEPDSPLSGALSEQTVVELLHGDTDVRDAMLFLIQYGPIMDPVQRIQREQILQTLVAHANLTLTRETASLARETARMANWTRWAVWTAVAATIVTNVVVVITR